MSKRMHVPGFDRVIAVIPRWIDVNVVKPKCKRDPDALGTPVLIWPRNPSTIRGGGVDGFAYFGKRATGYPAFYLHGAELTGVTHWQPMPKGPSLIVSSVRGAG